MFQKAFASKGIVWTIFSLLFAYLILRAWYVAPMHDEAATFLHYIENGEIWGELALKDANNHLLNSWLGRGIYLLAGDSFFALRIPALASFVLFFWSSYSLVKKLNLGNSSFIIFLSLNTIPWINDYFAYTRGYGIAIAFFILALSQIVSWIQTKRSKYLLVATMGIYLAVLANLTYLVGSILLIGFVLFYSFVHWKEFSWKTRISHGIIALTFILGLIPLIQFSFELKEAGALYYGSLDGLWNVTGKSICKNVLFYDAHWLKYLGVGVALLIGFLFLRNWKNLGFKQLTEQGSTWFVYLITGNIAAIVFLAKVMQVNYPEDRAAMYLIPLMLLAIGSLAQTSSWTKILTQGMWFFPIVFIAKINLNTSVFSPDDRMTEAFYTEATNGLKPDETVALYPIMQLTYPLWERKYQTIKHPALVQKDFEPYSDLILTKTTYLFPKDHWQKEYRVVAEDKPSSYIALRRIKPFQKQLIFDTVLRPFQTKNEYVDFIKIPIDSSWRNELLQIDVMGSIKTSKNLNTFNLVIATNDKKGQPFRYHYFNLRWFEGANKQSFTFNYPYTSKYFKTEESELIIYIWNREKFNVHVKDAQIRIKTLK